MRALPIFAGMGSPAMRCRRSLRGNDPKPLQNCIREAEGCGIHAMEKICSVTPTSPRPMASTSVGWATATVALLGGGCGGD